ncbi:MAG: hypothetical protein PHP51_07560 [Desulfotomaculaceae bacterium]|nr:hypothetical protein [Desulfotomaculaceae bacterium]MDD4766562.1 hypothetical protein [Desulfotomaculaceae bacterium]
MRQLTPGEVIQLREMLQMESNALAKAKATTNMITDEELRRQVDSGVLATESRIKGIQQFIVENNIITTEGVQ